MRELMPDLYEFEFGLRASMADVVHATLERLPDEVLSQLCPSLEDSSLVASFVYGLDGSGCHAEYNTEESLSADVDTSHFIIAGMALSYISSSVGGSMCWHDEKMCSSSAERPLIIVPGKEAYTLVDKVVSLLDEEAEQVAAVMLYHVVLSPPTP